MSDPVTGDGQSETSSESSERAPSMSRVRATLPALFIVGCIAIGVLLGIGIGNLHGWDWSVGRRWRARRVLALVVPGQSHVPERSDCGMVAAGRGQDRVHSRG